MSSQRTSGPSLGRRSLVRRRPAQALALTGLSIEELGWAMARREVRYRTTLPGHGHTPMLAREDVESIGRVAVDDPADSIGD